MYIHTYIPVHLRPHVSGLHRLHGRSLPGIPPRAKRFYCARKFSREQPEPSLWPPPTYIHTCII